MNRRALLLAIIGTALILLTAFGVVVLRLSLDSNTRAVAFTGATCLAGLLWLFAVAIVRRGGLPRWMFPVVLVVAVTMRVMTLVTPPLLSTDLYRYVWDGRVQLAGINPYRYRPDAPELAFLRDATVYPNINRADYAHTIYPPAAEAIYGIAALVTPGVFGMKLMMTAFDALTIVVLIRLLRIAGRDPARLLIYAWLPLPVWEFAGNAHIDAAASGLLALALLLAVRGRAIWTGVVLAVAALTKFLPAVVLPAFWRPREWRLLVAFTLTLIALYVPYATVGWKVLGFLGGYVSEEGIASGRGIFLLELLGKFVTLPVWATKVYLALVLGVLGLIGVRFALFTSPALRAGEVGAKRRVRVLHAARSTLTRAALPRDLSHFVGEVNARQASILGAVLLIAVSPHYPWYVAWLAPLACLAPSPSVLWMLAAAPLLAHGAVEYLVVPAAVYGTAIALAIVHLYRRSHLKPYGAFDDCDSAQGSAPLLRGRGDPRDPGNQAAGLPVSGGDQPVQSPL
jgi:alpha-1,6-mannosyltransferase